MLDKLFEKLEEKIIVVSNYTETLDIFQKMCIKKNYPFVRFDGKTNIAIR
jgi:DNA repair and recombination RAD54-like protein